MNMSQDTDTELLDLISLDRPVEWVVQQLETALLSPRLPEVAASLRRLLGTPHTQDTLPDVLGEYDQQVLAEGLRALPRERLNHLLRQPELLSELQEEILLAESPYWERLLSHMSAASPQTVAEAAPSLPSVAVAAGPPPAPDSSLVANATPQATAPAPGAANPRRRNGWLAAVAAAAAVWAVVSIWPGETRWGWQRPGVLTAEVSAPDYLRLLSERAGEFDQGDLTTAAGLDRRLTEMLAACQALNEAPHRPLTPNDRKWLQERCRDWIDKLEKERSRLRVTDVDTAVVREVRDASQKIIRTLRDKLNERANLIAERTA